MYMPDYKFRKSLSPTAKRAAAIVSRIRKHEADTVWTKETVEEEGDVYPGMMFTLAKDRMEKTELWRIVKKMPKGCLLHAHLEAMVDSMIFSFLPRCVGCWVADGVSGMAV